MNSISSRRSGDVCDVVQKICEESGVGLKDQELGFLMRNCLIKRFVKSDYILNQVKYGDKVFLILSGIVAAEFYEKNSDGISRFFSQGEIFTNIDSNTSGKQSTDSLIAITDCEVCILNYKKFLDFYTDVSQVGAFFRKLVLNAMLVDREVICLKTLGTLRDKQMYFETHFSKLFQQVKNKDIAAFFGVSPQSYSRFLHFC